MLIIFGAGLLGFNLVLIIIYFTGRKFCIFADENEVGETLDFKVNVSWLKKKLISIAIHLIASSVLMGTILRYWR